MLIENKHNLGDEVEFIPYKKKTPVKGKITAISTRSWLNYFGEVETNVNYTVEWTNKAGQTMTQTL